MRCLVRALAGQVPVLSVSPLTLILSRTAGVRPRPSCARTREPRVLIRGIAVAAARGCCLSRANGRGLMGYTAVHAGWGRLDASLDDLGCGRSGRASTA
jgi:hypothetical protein